MSPLCELYLFGPLRLEYHAEGRFRLRSRKAIATLAYVAAQESPLPRAQLADLFWSSDLTEHGYANLRWVLNHLNSSLPGCLTVSRYHVAWGQTLSCDLHRFVQLLRQNTIASLTAAVALYQGEMMAGFVLDGCPEFELWLTTERTRRLQQVTQAICTLSQYYTGQQNYQVALQYTKQWLTLAPWDEEAYRQTIYLLAVSGQRSAALQQYATCRQMLAAELGVEPSAETVLLYEEIRTDKLIIPKPSPVQPTIPPQLLAPEIASTAPISHRIKPIRPHNLPRQLTPFIGRTAELAQIEELLANPTCTWLTLLGPGGMGKTHLALAVAYKLANIDQSTAGSNLIQKESANSQPELAHSPIHPCSFEARAHPEFPDGVWFVTLAGITAVELLPTTIAQALNVALLPGDVRLQLLTYLHRRQLLLVLDNFEHLADGIELIDWLIRQAPGVKVLVTSRHRLHHQAEWVLDVGGLEIPPPAAVEKIATYTAVQLFVQCARQARTTFALTANNAAQISQICRMVDGMPLAIQLAASWVHSLPLTTIVKEISRNLDLGTLCTYGLPDRHHTLRAVIESSWQRLSEPEQALLARLSIFRGGADWTAAEQLVGATPLLLTSLVDKSLISIDTTGRMMLHELIRQFAAEQLQVMGITEETQTAHSRYYSALLAQQMDELIGDQTLVILQQWDSELDNIRAAWQSAIQRYDAVVIGQMAQPLNLYYDYRTLLQEARQSFQQATEVMYAAEPTPEHEIALGRVLACYGLLLWRYGELPLAEQVLQQSRTIATRYAMSAEEAYANYLLGYSSIGSRPWSETMAYLYKALAQAESNKNQQLIVKILYAVGLAYLEAGQIESSIHTLQRSLQLARTLRDTRSVAHVLCYLGSSYFAAQDYARAKERLEEGLMLFQTIKVQWGVAQAHYGLLQVAYVEGDYAEVKRLSEITIPLYEETGVHPVMLATMKQIYAEIDTSSLPLGIPTID